MRKGESKRLIWTECRWLLGAFYFMTFFVVSNAFSDIIRVPEGLDEIQYAIEEIFDDDTILVAPGTYPENLDFLGKRITVGSYFLTTGDPAYIDSTVIDGEANGAVVRFMNGEDAESILTGFTLANGSGFVYLDEYVLGGAIYCRNSSPVLTHLKITNNVAESGGGIYLRNASPLIEYCAFINNEATRSGGGIYCSREGTAPVIRRCLFSGNIADNHGGAVCLYEGATAQISNITAYGNRSSDGAIATYSRDDHSNRLTIANSIFWQNTPFEIVSGAVEDWRGDSVWVDYCDIENGVDGAFSGEGNFMGYGDNNFSEYPEFASIAWGNFSLRPVSPCIDRGDPDTPVDPDATRADQGAFYFHQRDVHIDQQEIEFEPISAGESVYKLLPIENTGGNALTVRLRWMEDNPCFYFREDEEFLIGGNTLYESRIYFMPDAVGEFENVLIIESNDPDEARFDIEVRGAALQIGDKIGKIVENFKFVSVYPNPFNAVVNLKVYLPKAQDVSLRVYDVHGREMLECCGDVMLEGGHAFSWDGSEAPAGLYFAVLEAEGVRRVRKMAIVK